MTITPYMEVVSHSKKQVTENEVSSTLTNTKIWVKTTKRNVNLSSGKVNTCSIVKFSYGVLDSLKVAENVGRWSHTQGCSKLGSVTQNNKRSFVVLKLQKRTICSTIIGNGTKHKKIGDWCLKKKHQEYVRIEF